MPNVKTAISIQEALFNEIDVLAHKMHISRSQLFAMAAKEFMQKQQNRRLLEQINKVYDDAPDSQQKKWLERSRAAHRKLVEGQW